MEYLIKHVDARGATVEAPRELSFSTKENE